MVFTHLPSNVLLGAVALMPTLPLAIAALLGRSALSQMDVPARQSYIAEMVDPEERIAAVATTNSARYAARPLGPVAAGSLMQEASLSAPFLAAGGIKSRTTSSSSSFSVVSPQRIDATMYVNRIPPKWGWE
jgi:predicted MFS family arabinose efflux permease